MGTMPEMQNAIAGGPPTPASSAPRVNNAQKNAETNTKRNSGGAYSLLFGNFLGQANQTLGSSG